MLACLNTFPMYAVMLVQFRCDGNEGAFVVHHVLYLLPHCLVYPLLRVSALSIKCILVLFISSGFPLFFSIYMLGTIVYGRYFLYD